MPHPLHEQVRQAFDFRCGYCRVDETSAGAELTVDHYCPLAAGGADDLLNRPQLVAQRLERHALDVERQRLQLLQAELEQDEQTIRVLQQYIHFLLRLGVGKNPLEDD